MQARVVLLTLCASFLYAFVMHADERADVPPVVCADSADFVVRSFEGGPSALDVLRASAQLRRQLAEAWLGDENPAAWNPRCEVIVHPTRRSYLQTVGQGGAQTSGSSLVQSRNGRIVTRRIDLCPDARGELSSLAHELTHVVLADRFGGRRPPRWLDEGIALLSDSERKQSLHQRDCRHALRSGAALRLAELLLLDRFTSSHQVASFYGQSRSLVQYLVDRDGPARLIAFAEAAMVHGYDRALSQHYGIGSVAELERHWRTYAVRTNNIGAKVRFTSVAR